MRTRPSPVCTSTTIGTLAPESRLGDSATRGCCGDGDFPLCGDSENSQQCPGVKGGRIVLRQGQKQRQPAPMQGRAYWRRRHHFEKSPKSREPFSSAAETTFLFGPTAKTATDLLTFGENSCYKGNCTAAKAALLRTFAYSARFARRGYAQPPRECPPVRRTKKQGFPSGLKGGRVVTAARAKANAARAEARACLSEAPTPLQKISQVPGAISQRR